MRAWLRGIDWAAIVGSVLVLAFGLVVFVPLARLPEGPHEPQYRDCECQDDYPRPAEAAPPGFVERTISDPVAAFTAALALFSLVLTVVSFVQIRFLIRADVTAGVSAVAAKTAAEAAKKSADAAMGAELPRLILIRTFMVDLKEDAGKALQSPALVLSFTNHGRTSAVITEQAIGWLAGSLLGDPRYGRIEGVDLGTVIEPGKEHEIRRNPNRLTRGQIKRVIDGELTVWLYGFVGFLDFLNVPHRTGFCLRIEVESPWMEGIPPKGKFVQDGPGTYIYSK